jgi:hypothetical protein
MKNDRQLDPILISKKQGRELGGASLRTLEYAVARREIESRVIGRRRFLVYKSFVRWLARDHPGPVAGPAGNRIKKGDINQVQPEPAREPAAQ